MHRDGDRLEPTHVRRARLTATESTREVAATECWVQALLALGLGEQELIHYGEVGELGGR